MTDHIASRLIIIFVGVLFAWQGVIWVFDPAPFLLASPWQTASQIATRPMFFAYHAAITGLEIVLGLIVAFLVGMCTAIMITRYQKCYDWTMPVLIISQAVPVFAIAPLLVLWLGFGLASKIAMAAMIIYFPITSNLVDGLRNTPKEWLDFGVLYKMSAWDVLWRIRMPAAWPQLASGLRVAIVSAPIGAVVGEWMGASSGLGFVMLQANARMQSDTMFGGLSVLAILAVTLFYANNHILARISRKLYGTSLITNIMR